MWMYGFPVPANASIAASTTAESRFALVSSPGLAVWMAPSVPLSRSHDRGLLVEIDHGRRGATRRDALGLVVVADERRHLVAVLEQLREDVRSDEPCRAGQCHVHD